MVDMVDQLEPNFVHLLYAPQENQKFKNQPPKMERGAVKNANSNPLNISEPNFLHLNLWAPKTLYTQNQPPKMGSESKISKKNPPPPLGRHYSIINNVK